MMTNIDSPGRDLRGAESVHARPLKIGIDVLWVRPGLNGGGEIFIRSLVAALAEMDRSNEYHLFVTPRNAHLFAGLPDSFRLVVCRFPGGRFELFSRLAWEQSVLKLQARRRKLDVMHFPGNLVPAGFPVPAVLTVHDFSSLFYRERLNVKLRPTLRLLDRERLASCVRARFVAPISRATADEVLRRTNVDPARVRVVHLAPREMDVPSLEDARTTLQRYGIRDPFILSVATLNHHKNLVRLLEAYAAVRAETEAMPPLVLVGGAGTASSALASELDRLGITESVVRPGYVPDEDIPAFYRGAELYVIPSLYEGFGMPLAEAASCGTPVLSSNAACLPEVGGDAAHYFDPWNVEDMAAALRRVLASPELRRELGSRGPAQAARFTWSGNAAGMLELYRAAAGG
jgi:glycosyltransferase involved in cell wall biosynthesis